MATDREPAERGRDDPGERDDSGATAPDDSATEAADGERDPDVDPAAVLSAFEDAAPRTLGEVAGASDLDRAAVAATLDALVERDALCHKRVTGVDVSDRSRPMDDGSDAPAVDLWYLPAERLEGGDVVVTIDDDRAVEETLADLSFPGASELMRDWRRDAVREAYEYVREQGPVAAQQLCEAVYPAHSAGYATEGDWWDCVEPRLRELPGVAEDDGVWRVD